MHKLVVILALVFSFGIWADAPLKITKEKTAFERSFAEEIQHYIDKVALPDKIKKEIKSSAKELINSHYISKKGEDTKLRPVLVTLQGCIEQSIATYLELGRITSSFGIIITPSPATPLCSKGDISPFLVEPSLLVDKNRLYTVEFRTTIIRDYLNKSGRLYIVYPESGLHKRTNEQIEIYKAELQKYEGTLFDVPLKTKSIPPEILGALYIFEDKHSNLYAFIIKAAQANAPNDELKWELWFGKTTNPSIKKQISNILDFIEKSQGPNLKPLLNKKKTFSEAFKKFY